MSGSISPAASTSRSTSASQPALPAHPTSAAPLHSSQLTATASIDQQCSPHHSRHHLLSNGCRIHLPPSALPFHQVGCVPLLSAARTHQDGCCPVGCPVQLVQVSTLQVLPVASCSAWPVTRLVCIHKTRQHLDLAKQPNPVGQGSRQPVLARAASCHDTGCLAVEAGLPELREWGIRSALEMHVSLS